MLNYFLQRILSKTSISGLSFLKTYEYIFIHVKKETCIKSIFSLTAWGLADASDKNAIFVYVLPKLKRYFCMFKKVNQSFYELFYDEARYLSNVYLASFECHHPSDWLACRTK